VSDVSSYLRRSKIVVIPSILEFSGYAALEALINGAQVVVSDNSGLPEVRKYFKEIDDRVFEFRNGNSTSLANSILQALSSPPDQRELELQTFKLENQLARRDSEIEKTHHHDIYPSGIAIEPKFVDVGYCSVKDVTCVIPHYNLSSEIELTIHSLLETRIPVQQIIVVDDGSNTFHRAKIQSLARELGFTLILKLNGGLSSARNAGLNDVKTKLVLFIDADDSVKNEFFEKQFKLLSKYRNVGATGVWIECFGESSNLIPTWDMNSILSVYKNSLNSASLLWKTQVIREIGGFDEEMKMGYEDYEAALRALASGFVLPVIDEFLFNYRVRSNSMFKSLNLNMQNILTISVLEKNQKLLHHDLIHLIGLIYTNGHPALLTSIQLKSNSNFQLENQNSIFNSLKQLYSRFPLLRKAWKFTPQKIQNLLLQKFLN
ncbi:MAG: glycosyltransferase, partial [Crocinitomicaceae bacterium]|nr:glycosyltransferase [Crocinitomicaceae bacterium]